MDPNAAKWRMQVKSKAHGACAWRMRMAPSERGPQCCTPQTVHDISDALRRMQVVREVLRVHHGTL